ncbi:hypothetical protein N7541_005516 [Penicillium brevicompactum]|uniref:Zn(2)-C6 fungal-type domain-containing protein n=1 Tax=Penicillium brevicompactum TaxID=5074 RepID=A0A9W9R682_PENBR|nr:hypothetical protein N7541_005516 [Penicillium brevicompactum]
MTRQSKTRRTRSLGGCKTCKRRHVKCDQTHPSCQTCTAMGLACEGFSDGVHWMSDKKSGSCQKSTTGKRGHLTSLGIRHHLYTGLRRSMGALISKGLVSGSIDASLQEIDLRSQDPSFVSNSETQVGPFAVLNFSESSISIRQQENTQERSDHPISPLPTHLDGSASHNPSYPLFDIPGFSDEVLQWSDLFNTGDDFQAILSDPSFGLGSPLDFQCSSQMDGRIIVVDSALENAPHQPSILEQPIAPIDILADAAFLLQTFQKDIVPQMTVVPLAKSPWNMLNVPHALITLGELTIMESQDVKHARQANLYSLLACSARFLETSPSTESFGLSPRAHWKEIADQAYSKARSHMDISLVKELNGANKAKLKDQLMALYGLIEFAIFSNRYLDARKYLIDAERLLRFRALAKCEISQKLRLLFNIYGWLRLIGESTYVLHNYVPSDSFINNLNANCQIHKTPAGEKSTAEIHERCRRIDDFLYFEHSEVDLNIDEPKDRRLDLPDIHLQDSRMSVESLCQQVYGIPETMLSLVSQTTRLANVMETLQNAHDSNIPISDQVWKTLKRRRTRLENVINSFRGRELASSTGEAQISPYKLMVQALNTALVIFFYRRVRQVHPAVLSGYVDHIITTFREWLALVRDGSPVGPGALWPIFIAGCEATTKPQRDAILDIVDQAGIKSGFAPFKIAKDIMAEVWRTRDQQQAVNIGDPLPSWIDVLKAQRIWPMFC